IQRRTINSLVIKTNKTLKEEIIEEEQILNYEIISIINDKEYLIYKFSIQIISNINCQPYFNENQQLYFNLNKQLIAWAQSGIYLSTKIKLIIQLNIHLNFSNYLLPPFNGISPLILQINENISKGSILTIINNNNNKLNIKQNNLTTKIIDINENNEIITTKEIDYEEFNENILPLSYYLFNSNLLNKENSLEILININNINDNKPIFEQKYYNFILEKNSYVGYIIGQINAFDKDKNGNK
ncbi:hypothetical protein Mgra_00003177, partial [Meloidogyne graminicola]